MSRTARVFASFIAAIAAVVAGPVGQHENMAATIVPGARNRRRLYYRYLQSGTRPRVRP